MSATIYWEPVDPSPAHLYVMAPSWFMGCLSRAGMELPHTFSKNDIPVLKGLAASMAAEDDNVNPFMQLIKAIEDHNHVSVWAQY